MGIAVDSFHLWFDGSSFPEDWKNYKKLLIGILVWFWVKRHVWCTVYSYLSLSISISTLQLAFVAGNYICIGDVLHLWMQINSSVKQKNWSFSGILRWFNFQIDVVEQFGFLLAPSSISVISNPLILCKYEPNSAMNKIQETKFTYISLFYGDHVYPAAMNFESMATCRQVTGSSAVCEVFSAYLLAFVDLNWLQFHGSL